MSKRKSAWTDEQEQILRKLYPTTSTKDMAKLLGKTQKAILNRCSLLGLNKKHIPISINEIERIKEWYTNRNNETLNEIDLEGLANELGRGITHISGIAKNMGLTRRKGRTYSEASKRKISESQKKRATMKEHPRPMLGKRFSVEWKEKHSLRMKARIFTEEQTRERIKKAIATKKERYGTPEKQMKISLKRANTNIQRYGTTSPHMKESTHAYRYVKAGKRDDLGDFYFRSSWEANYARYLKLLISLGVITSWDYECQAFIFDKALEGSTSYTPDFKVVLPDGSHEWHEVKGWLDEKSIEKLNRMALYYPNEKIVLIDLQEYGLIKAKNMEIPNWE